MLTTLVVLAVSALVLATITLPLGRWICPSPPISLPNAVARRPHYLAAAALFTLFVVYGSIVPCTFEAISLHDAITQFRNIPQLHIELDQQRGDWVATILLWAPIGFLALGALTVDEPSLVFRAAAAVLVSGFVVALAVGVEFLQVWFPPRTVSQNDIIASAAGGLAGVVAWQALGDLFTHGIRSLHHVQSPQVRWQWLAAFYTVALIGLQLSPFDFVVSWPELEQKRQEGRLCLMPFLDWRSADVRWPLELVRGFLWLPVGWAIYPPTTSASPSSIAPKRTFPWRVVGLGGLILIVQVARAAVFTRHSSTTQLLLESAGVWAGYALARIWPQMEAWWTYLPVAKPLRTSSWPWIFLMIGYAALLVGVIAFSSPTDLRIEWTQPRVENFWAYPFASMYWGSKYAALANIVKKLALFAPLGVLAGRGICIVRMRPWVGILISFLAFTAIGSVGLVVEVVQVFQTGYLPDVTDVLLAVVGGFVGWRFIHLVAGNSLPKSANRSTSKSSSSSATNSATVWPALNGLLFLSLAGCWGGLYAWERGRVTERLAAAWGLAEPLEGSAGGELQGKPFEDGRGPDSIDPHQPPRFSTIRLPAPSTSNAAADALGIDHEGGIWCAVTPLDDSPASAQLYEYDPVANEVLERGDPLNALRRAGKYREGMEQARIASPLVPASDGNLYFASTDDPLLNSRHDAAPAWGSHVWRMRLPQRRWEHLFAAPEGLVAIAESADWIYAVGFPDHVLYQYHVGTERLNSLTVGACDGHVTRAFFADHRGHVFVPRVTRTTNQAVLATLVEFDVRLKQVGETELPNYTRRAIRESSGIVASRRLTDRSTVFQTDCGYIYRVQTAANGKTQTHPVGWLHPDGTAHPDTLMIHAGTRYVCGVGKPAGDAESPLSWLVLDLQTGRSTAHPIPLDSPIHACLHAAGRAVHDAAGRSYLAGSTTLSDIPLTDELERAVRSVGGGDEDVEALRDAARPISQPTFLRLDYPPDSADDARPTVR